MWILSCGSYHVELYHVELNHVELYHVDLHSRELRVVWGRNCLCLWCTGEFKLRKPQYPDFTERLPPLSKFPCV